MYVEIEGKHKDKRTCRFTAWPLSSDSDAWAVGCVSAASKVLLPTRLGGAQRRGDTLTGCGEHSEPSLHEQRASTVSFLCEQIIILSE